MQISPVVSEIAWGLLWLGITAFVFWAGAWSYPQAHDTIWIIGGLTMAAVAALSGRYVARARART